MSRLHCRAVLTWLLTVSLNRYRATYKVSSKYANVEWGVGDVSWAPMGSCEVDIQSLCESRNDSERTHSDQRKRYDQRGRERVAERDSRLNNSALHRIKTRKRRKKMVKKKKIHVPTRRKRKPLKRRPKRRRGKKMPQKKP